MARIMILVCALMTANLWLNAQAQINPVVTTVLGNGGIAYFTVPVVPAVAGGATAAIGVTPNFVGIPNYQYGYQVADGLQGDYHSHHESRHGHNVVGQYSLLEPTGNVRTVNYAAGTNGFQAQVQNTAG